MSYEYDPKYPDTTTTMREIPVSTIRMDTMSTITMTMIDID